MRRNPHGHSPMHHSVHRIPAHHGAGNGDLDDVQYDEDLFYYTQTFGSLAAGVTAQESLQIDADAHFKVQKLTWYATLTGGDAPFSDENIPELNFAWRDGSSGRDLTYAPIPFSSMMGTARLPALLPLYRIFKAKGVINMTVRNFSGANGYDDVQVTFIGTKLFPLN